MHLSLFRLILLLLLAWPPVAAADDAPAASAPAAEALSEVSRTLQEEAVEASRRLAEAEAAEQNRETTKKRKRSKKKQSDNSRPENIRLEPKYPVEIVVGNPEVKAMLDEHLPLLNYQRQEDLDAEQIEFLLEDAPADAKKMLRTEGYFNSEISIVPQGRGYRMNVDLGGRTQIDNVNVALIGDILQDDDLGGYYKNALNTWPLPVGAPFRQSDWSDGKVSLLTAVTRKKYPLAQLVQSRAEIDPAKQRADLNLTVDSKQPIYFGDIEVSGTKRYPEKIVRGLAKFQTGDPYDLDSLLDYQQDLENNYHYTGASVQADWDNMQNDYVPVKVAVTEARRQKFEAGLRYDSEYGLGGRLGYDHYNVLNRGYIGSVSTEIDKYQTITAVGISQPRNRRGYYNTANLAYERSTTQRLERRTLSGGIWRVRDRNGIESRIGIEFVGEDTRLPDQNIDLGRSYATMLTAAWKRQNISTLLRPANGYYLSGKIGATPGKLLSSSLMVRGHIGAGYFLTPENKKLGTLVLRGAAGYVYTNTGETDGLIPTVLMFRTGGAASVRGYELDSIGRRFEDTSTILPDRALAVMSAEYQIPFKKDFAFAVFHDAGAAAQRFQDMTLRHGTGLGLRWFSPIAPFSFDIAYGHSDKKIRWHISLGTRF